MNLETMSYILIEIPLAGGAMVFRYGWGAWKKILFWTVLAETIFAWVVWLDLCRQADALPNCYTETWCYETKPDHRIVKVPCVPIPE